MSTTDIDISVKVDQKFAPSRRATHEPQNKKNRLLTGAKLAVVIHDMLPTSDVLGYSVVIGTYAATQNPIISALAAGVTYFVTGTAAVSASANWIAEDRIGRAINVARRKIDDFKRILNEAFPRARPGRFLFNAPADPEVGKSLPLALKAIVALNFGIVILLAVMQRREPRRTAKQNRKDGMLGVMFIAGYLAIEGALISVGLANLTNPLYLTLVVLGFLGLQFIVRKARGLLERSKVSRGGRRMVMDTEVFATVDDAARFTPRYDLTQAELSALEKDMLNAVKKVYPRKRVYSVLIDPRHPFANFVRGHEAMHFPEAKEFPAELEENTLFFALIDTRRRSHKVVHVGTVSGPQFLTPYANGRRSGRTTGFVCIDELVKLGNFTVDEFRQYYQERLNLDHCMAVETNIRINRKGGKKTPRRYRGIRTVDLAYLTLFRLIEEVSPEIDKAAVFASVNERQAESLRRRGIEFVTLMGRKNFITPESREGRVSMPVAIIYNKKYRAIFSGLGPRLPVVRFKVK